jgi:hypothetical protein
MFSFLSSSKKHNGLLILSEEQQPFLRGDSHPSKNINHRASRVKREWQDRDSEAG